MLQSERTGGCILIRQILLLTIGVFVCSCAFASTGGDAFGTSYEQFLANQDQQRSLAGAASRLEKVGYFIVRQSDSEKIQLGQQYLVPDPVWLVVAGRFETLLVSVSGVKLALVSSGEGFEILTWVEEDASRWGEAKVAPYFEAEKVLQGVIGLRFAGLLSPLDLLAQLLSQIITFLASFQLNWGISIGIFYLILRGALVPVSLLTLKYQREVEQIDKALLPNLKRITSNYAGEEKHRMALAEYEKLNLSPFYRLKPALGLIVLIPVWIASGYTIGQTPDMRGKGFLWITDLTVPDQALLLDEPLPIIGSELNALPILLLVIILLAVVGHKIPGPRGERILKRVSLALAAIVFCLFIYPFPSAVIYYCVLAVMGQTLSHRLFAMLSR